MTATKISFILLGKSSPQIYDTLALPPAAFLLLASLLMAAFYVSGIDMSITPFSKSLTDSGAHREWVAQPPPCESAKTRCLYAYQLLELVYTSRFTTGHSIFHDRRTLGDSCSLLCLRQDHLQVKPKNEQPVNLQLDARAVHLLRRHML